MTSKHETESDYATFTVAELAEVLNDWPREVNGVPTMVYVGISASRMKQCKFVSDDGGNLLLDGYWNDTSTELVQSMPDLPPIELALSAFSYAINTPDDIWDRDYFQELAIRAMHGLECLLHAKGSLATTETNTASTESLPTRLVRLPWRILSLLARRDRTLNTTTRLLLAWWLLIESFHP